MILQPTFVKKEEWPELLLGQMLLFGLLGKALYAYPEAGWLAELIDEDIFSDAPFAAGQPDVSAGLTLLKAWQEQYLKDSQANLLALQKEHTRLFTLPGKLPVSPWESVYFSEERLLFEERTLDVRRWYGRFGLEPVNIRREPDDHIGLELSFLAHLAGQGVKALENGEQEKLEELQAASQDFCQQHILNWMPLWCDQMLTFAQTFFYRGLALLLRGALDELADQQEEARQA